MKFFRYTILIILLFTFSKATDDLDKLYNKAKNLELKGYYKEAMLVYKELAVKDRNYIDESKIEAVDIVENRLNTIKDKKTLNTLEQILSSSFNLHPYNVNYFLPFSYDTKKRNGRKQIEAKFQLSVKKPLVTNFFGFDETINFGYTQTSWWQLYGNSAPFRETNYRPEIFVTVPYGKSNKTSLKGFKFGFLHESNGQKGTISRSWNRLYLESYFQVNNLFITPRIWYRLPEKEKDDDNSTILDYLGYGDLNFSYLYKTHTFKLLLRNNLKLNDKNKGFVEFDWSFPFFNSKDTFGYVQLSSGYGDSLIDYDKEINRISFGISLSR